MTKKAPILLSAFSDEAAVHKTAVEQFSAMAALGLEYYSIRFIDIGQGIKNVMELTKREIVEIRQQQQDYGLTVASLGSPIGKVKLRDVADRTKNRYVPFKQYLAKDVRRACNLAQAFDTRLIRGFSFYHPSGTEPVDCLPQVVDQLGKIAECCDQHGLTFGLEVEGGLVGQNGHLLAKIHRQVNHPALVLVFDAANILCQGYSTAELWKQYRAMKPGIGWLHIKDYQLPRTTRHTQHAEEDIIKHLVPADQGDSGHEAILRDLSQTLPRLTRKLRRRGVPGVFLDLEPHLKGGGQFGGFSGPDGMGVAARSLCRLLDYLDIDYHLRDFADVRSARGF